VRILIFTQYFTPEVGATQTRLHTFAAGLAARGHDVEVICEVPNHPQGVVHPGYRRRPVHRRRADGFTAWHAWVMTSPNKTPRSRLAFYGSYTAMATVVGSLRPRPDVIFASSPPLPVAIAAASVAARHRVPWVLDVRDLWPEAAVALGELSSPRMLRLAERLESRLYRSAAAITATTEPFRRAVAAKTDRPGKVSVLPNGTTRLWVEGAALEVDKGSLGLPPDRFVWTFAGNIGIAQGLETAIDAAGRLGDGFQLLLLGDGPAREKLERRAAGLPRRAVEFHDQVPPQEAVRYLRASDALLVPLAAEPVLESFVPSKLFDFCAVSRPVIVSAAGEAQRLALSSGAALGAKPGDPGSLAAAVTRLARDPELRDKLSRTGHAFAAQNLREEHVQRLADLLDHVAATRRRART